MLSTALMISSVRWQDASDPNHGWSVGFAADSGLDSAIVGLLARRALRHSGAATAQNPRVNSRRRHRCTSRVPNIVFGPRPQIRLRGNHLLFRDNGFRSIYADQTVHLGWFYRAAILCDVSPNVKIFIFVRLELLVSVGALRQDILTHGVFLRRLQLFTERFRPRVEALLALGRGRRAGLLRSFFFAAAVFCHHRGQPVERRIWLTVFVLLSDEGGCGRRCLCAVGLHELPP
mmetsp:Transcript_12070/g.29242  ORF Transcript_12070/g.29242 Transcript_12070/m.29242 type:complete len:232 (-) Transcript_12070:2336-3031(-)